MTNYNVVIASPGHECNAWCRPPQHCDTFGTCGLDQSEVEAAYRREMVRLGLELVSIERTYEATYRPIIGFWPDTIWLLTWRASS